jgi:hypothetical protein
MGDYNGKVDAGPPPKGAAVDVIWTDDKSYDGHCESVTYRKLNNVFFCEGSRTFITAARPDFCHADENLSKDSRIQLDKQRATSALMGRLKHVCPGIQLQLSF